MKRIFLVTCLMITLGAAGLAQSQQRPKFSVYGQTIEERASTRIGYWRTNVNAGIGEVVISYGRPPWNPQRAQQMEQLRGRMWRLGDNYWSLLDTNLPIRLGEMDVPVGLYYIAVVRSKDGNSWDLALIDPEKSRAKGLDSYDVGTRPSEIPVLLKIPLKFEPHPDQTVEKLTILLKLNKGSKTDGQMTISWGNFKLNAPIQVELKDEG